MQKKIYIDMYRDVASFLSNDMNTVLAAPVPHQAERISHLLMRGGDSVKQLNGPHQRVLADICFNFA